MLARRRVFAVGGRFTLRGENVMRVGKVLQHFKIAVCALVILLTACATARDTYIDPGMDFGAIRTVAVMPFAGLTKDAVVPERVRDVFIIKLLSTEAVYVLPTGEVARGVARAEIQNPSAPSAEETVKLGGIIKAQALITGVVREYGEVRSGTASANVISLSLEMIEAQTGKIVWAASSTRGGITLWDRLFGGGGQPMNLITEKAVNDLINKLFK